MSAIFSRHRTLFCIVAIGVVAAVTSTAGPAQRPPPAYERAEQLVFQESPDRALVAALLTETRRIADQFVELPRLYWRARAYLLHGAYLKNSGLRREAIGELELGLAEIAELVAKEDSSEGWRVLADTQAHLIELRGTLYMMRHGEATRNAALRALELDPNNVKAHITAAGFYINAPSFAGGDVRKAVTTLERALQLNPTNANDRFLIHGWLVDAYRTLGQQQSAREQWLRARAIYPDSGWLAAIAARARISP